MKTPNLTRTLPCFLVLLALLAPGLVKAETLLTDHFDYPAGDNLGSNGWTLIGGSGGASTPVVAQNLSYSGFAESSGNAVQLRPNGQDWYRTYTTQDYTTSDNAALFYSFLMRVDNLGTLDSTGGYFAGLGNLTAGGIAATVGIRLSGSGFQLGIGKRDFTAMENFSFSDTVYSVGQTILVVGAYNFVSGPINNDFASLWIDPSGLGQLNPPPTSLNTPLSGSNDDLLSFSSFILRPLGNDSSTQIPGSLIFDELRVGNSWADVALVPEPSLTHMLMVGLLGSGVFLWVRRRRAGL
jgi:hypothetical protein